MKYNIARMTIQLILNNKIEFTCLDQNMTEISKVRERETKNW